MGRLETCLFEKISPLRPAKQDYGRNDSVRTLVFFLISNHDNFSFRPKAFAVADFIADSRADAQS